MPVGTVKFTESCFHIPLEDGTSAIHAYESFPLVLVYSASISVAVLELYDVLYVYVAPPVTAAGAEGCQLASPVEFELSVTDAPFVPAFPATG